MSDLIVQKFGGSSLARPEQIVAIAKKISELHKAGQKLIVVVSAMGKTTDELVALAHKVSAFPDRRELDMLLSTGERVSMALLSMALKDLNCPSISFTGSQAGVLTDGSHSNANIIDVRPVRVTEALDNNKVVVLAGFQGVDPRTKEITTLGRGGSDTTAVAMAAHFKASRCEILKDVDGICSADPKLVKNTVHHKVFPLEALYDMCFWGAKVLHSRSVELALREKVHLAIGRSDTFSIGTDIKPLAAGGFEFSSGQILAVNSHKEVVELTIKAQSASDAEAHLQETLASEKMPWPQVLEQEFANGEATYWCSGDTEYLDVLRQTVRRSSACRVREDTLASVTATAFGSIQNSTVTAMTAHLKKAGVAIMRTVPRAMSISYFIPDRIREIAVHELHSFVSQ